MSSLPHRSLATTSPQPEEGVAPSFSWSTLFWETVLRLSPRPLLFGLCTRPVLLAPIAFVFLVVVFDAGADYGVRDQILHELLPQQFINGLVVSLLFAFIATIAYLSDAKKDWVDSIPERSIERGCGIDRRWRWYLDCSWVPLMLLFLGVSLWHRHWAFAVGLTLPMVIYYPIRWLRWWNGDGLIDEESSPPVEKPSLFDPFGKQQSLPQRIYEFLPHVPTFVLGASLCLLFMSQGWLAAVCFALSLWAGVHGILLHRSTSRRIERAEDRRFHDRVWYVFAACFVFYHFLFVVYCIDTRGYVIPWLASPAVVTFLLVAQLLAIHGFLRYYLGEIYVLLVIGFVVLIACQGGTAKFKHRLPGLDYNDVVQLDEADFEGSYANLLMATQDLQHAECNPDLLDRVMAKFHRMALLLRSRELRWRDRRDLASDPRADEPDLATLPTALEVSQALEERRYSDAYAAYHRWKQAFDDLSVRLEQFEVDGLETWKKLVSPSGKKPKLIVVAVSGGANRAALWTTCVLDHLEQTFDKQDVVFSQHLRLLTGASGGMVGASYWVSTIDEKQRRHVIDDHDLFVGRIARECLTPVVHHATFLDFPTTWLRNRFPSDRGSALEHAWSVNLEGALDRPIRELAPGEAEGWRPSLVFSPMLIEDGRRLLISNLSLAFLTESGGTSLSNPEGRDSRRRNLQRPPAKPTRTAQTKHLPELPTPRRDRYSLSAIEFFQLFPQEDRLRLSTAVRMSASFPYVSPAADLPLEPRRRVVDAGYYDNYGVDVAASWLYQYRTWLEENTSGVVLIQVRDAMSERRRLYAESVSLPLEGITGPLVGVGSARVASMSFRNDQLVQVLSDYFNRHGKPMFTTVVFEAPGDVAMSWYLTQAEISRIKSGFAPDNEEAESNRRSLERLLRWWRRDQSEP